MSGFFQVIGFTTAMESVLPNGVMLVPESAPVPELAALVHPVDMVEKLDVTSISGHVLARQEYQPAIPARPGQPAQNAPMLQHHMHRERQSLLTTLAAVGQCVEFALRVKTAPAADRQNIKTTGADYLRQRQHEQTLSRQLLAEAMQPLIVFLDGIKPLVKNWQNIAARHTGTGGADFLVTRLDMDTVVGQWTLLQLHSTTAALIGPWAPFSFARLSDTKKEIAA